MSQERTFYNSPNDMANGLLWRNDARQESNAPFSDNLTANDYQSDFHDPPLVQGSNSYPMKQLQTQYQPISEDTSYTHEPMIPSENSESLAIRSTLTSWSFELLAIAVSIASIVAIIVVLDRENDRPLAAWTFAITLNTIIATLGTVARSTLAFAISACIGQQKWAWFRRKPDRLTAFDRFDEASKGPLGGARLLYWLRLRHWASLGALVTVGTTAFDPFLQAVLDTYGRWDGTPTSVNATIGYAHQVDGGQEINWGNTGPQSRLNTSDGVFETVNSDIRPDFGTVSSLYSGIYNSSLPSTETLAFQCSTGNCTWPLYVSAAVCSKCEDLSDQLKATPGSGSDGSTVPNQGNLKVSADWTQYSLPYGNIRNWNAPFNKKDANWWDYTYYGNAKGMARTFMTANTTFSPRTTVKFQDVDSLLMSFLMIRAGNDWLTTDTPWNQSKPIATECALYLCVNAYNTSSESNVLQDSAVGSWAVRDPSSFQLDSDQNNADKWDTKQGNTLYEPLLNFKKSDLRLLVPKDAASDLNLSTPSVNFTQKYIKTLVQNLIKFTSHNPTSKRNYTQVRAFPDIQSPDIMDALWNSTNTTATFANIATSLTNQIRSASSEHHRGTLQTWVIHVRVNWAYLAYPITMLVIGIAYVILTIIESMRLQLPIWKESSLPGLLYGFNDETQRLLRGSGKAEDVRVRFGVDQDEKCMRLVAS